PVVELPRKSAGFPFKGGTDHESPRASSAQALGAVPCHGPAAYGQSLEERPIHWEASVRCSLGLFRYVEIYIGEIDKLRRCRCAGILREQECPVRKWRS